MFGLNDSLGSSSHVGNQGFGLPFCDSLMLQLLESIPFKCGVEDHLWEGFVTQAQRWCASPLFIAHWGTSVTWMCLTLSKSGNLNCVPRRKRNMIWRITSQFLPWREKWLSNLFKPLLFLASVPNYSYINFSIEQVRLMYQHSKIAKKYTNEDKLCKQR